MWHAWDRREKCTRFWWESQKEKDHLKDQGVDGIRMDLKEIGLGGVDWIRLAQDRDRWHRRYSSYSFSTSALDGGEWSASHPGRAFTPGERTPSTHWTGGWVSTRAGLDTEDRGKILFIRPILIAKTKLCTFQWILQITGTFVYK
jgi:alpha-glucosidase (family GH31 glycosyl hydrolase)